MTRFSKVCEQMGGEYDEEEGLLEPDVGGEFLEEHEARKEWCTLENAPGIERLIVFNAPNTFSITIRSTDPSVAGEFLSIWDNDIKKEFNLPRKEKRVSEMCFEAELGIRAPKGTYCIKGGPSHIWMTIEPESLEHRLR